MVSLKKLKHLQIHVADIFISTVPILLKENKTNIQDNIDYIVAAAEKISPYLKDGDLIIESTSQLDLEKSIYTKKSLRCDMKIYIFAITEELFQEI